MSEQQLVTTQEPLSLNQRAFDMRLSVGALATDDISSISDQGSRDVTPECDSKVECAPSDDPADCTSSED